MVDVDEYLKKSGGNWLRADHVVVGDKLAILDEGIIDDKTFDRAYLVLQVSHQRVGETYSLRLGPKNVKRISDVFGSKTKDWVGRFLEIISIESYSGLGQKGFLLRGVQSIVKPSVPGLIQQATVDAIRKSKDIMEMGVPLTEDDFKMISAGVRAELLKYGYVRKTDEGYFFTEKCKELL